MLIVVDHRDIGSGDKGRNAPSHSLVVIIAMAITRNYLFYI
jgi:hypothetical protein